MTGEQPKFISSPYFVNEPGNWHLKQGAPADVVAEFTAYMDAQKEMEHGPQKPGRIELK